MVEISIVVISKNEELFIEKSLDSILKFSENTSKKVETILIDSNSSDSTLVKAREYQKKINLKIVKIPFSTRYSASLSRNIGTKIAEGKYILYLDGDMELFTSFVDYAIQKINSNPFLTGAIGIRNDILFYNNTKKDNVYNVESERIAPHFGGALLIEADSVRNVGNYSKELFSSEEPDLYLKLIKKNKFVIELPIEMINHHEKKNNKVKYKNLLFSNRISGVGQMYINSIKKGYFSTGFESVATRYYFVSFTLDIFCVIFTLLLFINMSFFILIIAIQILLALYALKKYSWKKFILSKLYFFGLIKLLFISSKVSYSIEIEEKIKE